MLDHERAVTEWAQRVSQRIPALAPQMDEIVDHLLTAIEDRIGDGATAEEAFNSTIAAFGEPADVSREFKRHVRALAMAQITAALVWATAIVASAWAGQDHTSLLLVAYLFTTLIPLSIIERRQRRRSSQ